MKRQLLIGTLVTALAAVTGCFDEPSAADRAVPEGSRVYLKEAGLRDLKDSVGSWNAAVVEYLNLDYNALTNADEVASLTKLKWLRLNDNQLASLPDLAALKDLRRIYLRNNRFEKVPETLKELPALTDIDLSGNPLTEVPEWLAKKEGLENLSFSRTRLTKLPDDLSAWKSLKSLQLGDLNLSTQEMARIRAVFDPKRHPLGTAVVF